MMNTALSCGHAPTYRLGHGYDPIPGTVDVSQPAATWLCRCGEPYLAHGVGTGYARTADGRTLCYPCVEAEERAAFAVADTYHAYDAQDRSQEPAIVHHLTTWTGAALARITDRWINRGGFGSRIVYLRAVAPDGSRWYGKHSADWSQAVTMRRMKGTDR